MGSELLEYKLLEYKQQELVFTFELKKQSTCSLQFQNKSDECVAFKVNTNNPKNYCVRPNIGVAQPMSTCELMVTMQAPKTPLLDMDCKDLFLIQSTIVPPETTNKDVDRSMFAKVNGRYIEQKKLGVVLITPSHSLAMVPFDENPEPEAVCEALPTPKDFKGNPEPQTVYEAHPAVKDQGARVEDLLQKLQSQVIKDMEELKLAKEMQELKLAKLAKDVEDLKLANEVQKFKFAQDVEEPPSSKDVVQELMLPEDEEKLHLSKELDKLKANVNELESKLIEADNTIQKLRHEKTAIVEENKKLKEELAKFKTEQCNGVEEVPENTE